ncbi:MAG: hypothetical protein COA42_01060 [Alteromonadaceae bacterium]|nr:MAG: hypothetical protein COA42_01060 [Alteromonadaceae bacterium]
MKVVSATEIKAHLGEYLDDAREQPIFVEKYGRPRTVLISYKRYLALIALEERLEQGLEPGDPLPDPIQSLKDSTRSKKG